jgi:hypothetical protein
MKITPDMIESFTLVIGNLRHVRNRDRLSSEPGPLDGPLWGTVGYVFGLGTTTAMDVCRQAGYDPHEPARQNMRSGAMSVLAHTQRQLINAEAMITREERALADHPEFREAILHSIASLAKIKGQLEEQFAEAANSVGAEKGNGPCPLVHCRCGACGMAIAGDGGCGCEDNRTHPIASLERDKMTYLQRRVTELRDGLPPGTAEQRLATVEKLAENHGLQNPLGMCESQLPEELVAAELGRLTGEISRLRAATPDPDKLETLADWLDVIDAEQGCEGGIEVRWVRFVRDAMADSQSADSKPERDDVPGR